VATTGALADPATEADARALQQKAIQEDFLNLDYAAAMKKLQAGLGKCGRDGCSAAIRGSLLRDLGAMRILGGAVEQGRADFAAAVAADPTLELDPAYKNPGLDSDWREAKSASRRGASLPSSAAPSARPPLGDFSHTPAADQAIRTPLPIYVEYTGTQKLKRVLAKYRATGMSEWAPVDLKRMGDDGWGGLIPCKDVTEGKLEYFLQGFDAEDDPVATSGSRAEPFVVTIMPSITGAAPSLPGEPPPQQCGELVGVECPPDFPGCKSQKRAAGEMGKSAGEECERGEECESGSCSESHCGDVGPVRSQYHRAWLGLAVNTDLLLAPGAYDVCALNSAGTSTFTAGNPYVCYDPALGTDFPPGGPVNAAIDTVGVGRRDYVKGGLAAGPLTVLASFDYALDANVLLGGRAGYELFTYPGRNPGPAFPPFRLEARVTYLLGANAIAQTFAPVFVGAAGLGEFDAHVPVKVNLVNPPVGSAYQPGLVREDAWLSTGPAYVAAGVGGRLAFGGEQKNVALTAVLKGEAAFGGTSGVLFGVAPEAGIQYGF
jgi:hypothetical protein